MGACDAVGRHTDCDRLKSRGRKVCDLAVGHLLQHQGQRARPEGLCQRVGGRLEAPNRAGSGEVADMTNQRIEGRSALGLVEAGDRGWIDGACAQPVDRLSRKRDQAALFEATRGISYRGLAGRSNRGGQARFHCDQIPSFPLLAVRETQGYKPRSQSERGSAR